VEQISKLKKRPGKDMFIFGSSDLVVSFIPHGLIDEYRIMVNPVLLGSGNRLFRNGGRMRLKLAETKLFSSGITLLRYRPEK
jgi:dihydrofolate reductase